MTDKPWIIVPNWNGPTGFQHYKDRQPLWIKTYTELLHDDAYLTLTGDQRAILHGLWLEYASSRCQLRADTRSLTSRLRLRVTTAQLEALNHAGFIQLSASKPLAQRYQPASPDLRSRRELDPKAVNALKDQPTAQDFPNEQNDQHNEPQPGAHEAQPATASALASIRTKLTNRAYASAGTLGDALELLNADLVDSKVDRFTADAFRRELEQQCAPPSESANRVSQTAEISSEDIDFRHLPVFKPNGVA